jgi:8-amino-7-oxononanoate synthase
VPGLADHRLALVALHDDPALVVHREVHRADHVVAAVGPQPALRGRQQRRQDLRVVLELEEAEHPPAVVLVGVERVVDLGADAPHDAPVAPRAEQLRVAVLEEGVLAAAEEQPALDAQRGDPVRRGRVQPVRELDELAQLLATLHRPHVHGHGGAPYMPETSIDVFAKARDNERVALLRAAREADIVPYFRTVEGPARPVVEMEGAARIMLGSNNYLGLTGDERVIQGARDALERYGTGLTGSRLLNGTTALHLELEEEIADWQGTEDAIVFTTGHQANVGTLGTILGPTDTVVADSGDHASILDGCLLSRAKLRAFRHNRMDKLERMLERAANDGGGVLVVVDGVFSMEGDVPPLPEICDLCERFGARLMVDEAHGAGVLGARGAGATEHFGVEDRVDLRMGTFSKSLASCGGFIAGPADVIEFLRVQSRAFLFTASAVPAAVGAAQAALRIVRTAEGRELMAKLLANARLWSDGLVERGFKVVRHGDLVTPIVPVLVEDDWKAGLLWKALYDAGVFVNTALHPAVPPGGALLRTSVMATHDTPTLERALDAFASVKASFEAEHGALPGPAAD